MRTAQKRDILELIGTLHQAQDEIKKNIESKNYAFAQDMLGQCQNCAISIGEAVENSEGEEFVTLSYIEDYCDILYHVYEEINDSEDINANKVYKTLRKHLLKFENSIRNDVLAKKEMVFFPYKASMWDSLESVWRAADKDPECDAYVVPIPYYDRNPDGRFGREHYEGSAFPHDVPIVHYKKYDVSKRHPDAIFIHNPYDNNNYVTSVHPDFYSEKLKKYCEKLVYIPYYVSEETNSDAPEIMKAKTGFVLSGGVLNSDMVVVQSENTKRLYVNILEKHFPNVSRSYWEQKIQGLGSPKLDRVARIQRDDEKLPEKWREIIYTKTGERKKTILYNISLAALLENRDVLEKIKDVFDFFKNRQEVAIWWRPHPLYESTIASMRPDLLREYREIIERYKAEAWGIYDEGVDLEWAIAETDAYYGDSSSVVRLYKEAKKPVMLQNVYVRTKREIKSEEIPIWPSAFCVDGDDIWFVHGSLNILMRYNMCENYTYIVGKIPGEVMLSGSLYKGIYKWKNKIFLIPSNAREIAVYDDAENKFKKIQINNIQKYNGKSLFCKVYSREKYLYCMPINYEAILKIDMESDHIKYIMIKAIPATYLNDTTRINNEITAVYAYTNQGFVFDMKTDSVSFLQLGNQNRQFNNITSIGEQLYLFDKSTHSIIRILTKTYKEEKMVCNIAYDAVKMTAISSELMILDTGHGIQIVDSNGTSISQIKEERIIRSGSLYSKFTSGIESDNMADTDKSFYFSRNMYCVWQFEKGVFEKEFFMTLDELEFGKLKELFKDYKDMECEENDLYSLSVWVKGIDSRQKTKQELLKNCGTRILRAVKGENDLYGR